MHVTKAWILHREHTPKHKGEANLHIIRVRHSEAINFTTEQSRKGLREALLSLESQPPTC